MQLKPIRPETPQDCIPHLLSAGPDHETAKTRAMQIMDTLHDTIVLYSPEDTDAALVLGEILHTMAHLGAWWTIIHPDTKQDEIVTLHSIDLKERLIGVQDHAQ